jgi:hypothetical protein
MHITDWKSTAWLRALGQKSSSIVDDVEWRPGNFILKNLIGYFDPNNSDSYDDSNGGEIYGNLVAGGEDLCLINMDTVPAGESGAPDFEGPTTTTAGYMVGDGSDNYLGQCAGAYADDLSLNASDDFTLNVWVQVGPSPVGYVCPEQEGYIGVGAMNDYTNGGCAVGVMADGVGGGTPQRIAFFVGDPMKFGYPVFSARRSIGQTLETYKWYMISLVKETGRPIFGGGAVFDRITLYVNGIYQRLIPGTACIAGTQHGGEMVPSGVIGGTQSVTVMALMQEYSGMKSITHASNGGFGHILIYNRALKHSELRQNYLALKHIYYPWRQGGVIGPNHPNH